MEFMGYKSTTTNNFPALLKLYQQMTNTATLQGNQDNLAELIKKMPADEWAKINRDIDRVAGMVTKGAQDILGNAGKGISDFLGSITGQKQ